MENKFASKCAGWQGRLLNMAGRTTLVLNCMTKMISFMIYFYKVPVGAGKRCDVYRSKLVWQEDKYKKKYHLQQLPLGIGKMKALREVGKAVIIGGDMGAGPALEIRELQQLQVLSIQMWTGDELF